MEVLSSIDLFCSPINSNDLLQCKIEAAEVLLSTIEVIQVILKNLVLNEMENRFEFLKSFCQKTNPLTDGNIDASLNPTNSVEILMKNITV